MSRSSHLLEVLRPYKYGTFTSCLAGALVATSPSAYSWSFLVDVLLFFLSFAVLSYSGLYLLNDVVDLPLDSRHPAKQHRLVASRAISRRQAAAIAALLVLSGSAVGSVLSPTLPVFIGLFTILNVLYSLVLKRIAYVDLIGNTITHPLRVILGICLFGRLSIQHVPIILASAAFYLGTNSIKRHIEIEQNQSEYRPVLEHYSRGVLARLAWSMLPILAILITLAKSPVQLGLIAFVLFFYSFIIVSYWSGLPKLHRFVTHIITR